MSALYLSSAWVAEVAISMPVSVPTIVPTRPMVFLRFVPRSLIRPSRKVAFVGAVRAVPSLNVAPSMRSVTNSNPPSAIAEPMAIFSRSSRGTAAPGFSWLCLCPSSMALSYSATPNMVAPEVA